MGKNEPEAKLKPMQKLITTARTTGKSLRKDDVRYLVDSYYQIQDYRKRAANQVREMVKTGVYNEVIEWMFKSMKDIETNIKKALDEYTDTNPLGQWCKSITGIGPVISAGLIAHIDIEQAPTVGHIWRFAGLDPTVEWKKGQKRPWNPKLKTLCWIIGQSFVKVSNHPKDTYGHFYQERKSYEQKKNEAGEYAEQAKLMLKKFNIGKDTEAYRWYSLGKLPPAHIDQRAKRWTVKLFLAHYHEVAYELHFEKKPPKPYPIEYLGYEYTRSPHNTMYYNEP